jgi:LacI family transcriptional regulator
MRDHKLPIDLNLHLEGNFDRDCARRQVLKFLARHGRGGRPSVILAFNHLMTEGAMEALYELGMVIPGDMSVVSYDMVGMSPPVFKPVIACISQDSYRMGEQAGKLALRRLAERETGGRGKSVQVMVKSTLLEGDSLLDIN